MAQTPTLRVRKSLATHCADYVDGNTTELDNLIAAFKAIQAFDPNDSTNGEDSFWTIGSYHGEPMRTDPKPPPPPYPKDYSWWGGFCPHRVVLFPAWHRTYVLRLEEALRKHGPDPNLAMPFWDECANVDDSKPWQPTWTPNKANPTVVPWVLTTQDYPPNSGVANPLYSYKLKQDLPDNEPTSANPDINRFLKPASYQTVRYPLSGLVDNAEDQAATAEHNADPRCHTLQALTT